MANYELSIPDSCITGEVFRPHKHDPNGIGIIIIQNISFYISIDIRFIKEAIYFLE